LPCACVAEARRESSSTTDVRPRSEAMASRSANSASVRRSSRTVRRRSTARRRSSVVLRGISYLPKSVMSIIATANAMRSHCRTALPSSLLLISKAEGEASRFLEKRVLLSVAEGDGWGLWEVEGLAVEGGECALDAAELDEDGIALERKRHIVEGREAAR